MRGRVQDEIEQSLGRTELLTRQKLTLLRHWTLLQGSTPKPRRKRHERILVPMGKEPRPSEEATIFRLQNECSTVELPPECRWLFRAGRADWSRTSYL